MPETFETLGVRADLVQGLDRIGIQTHLHPFNLRQFPFCLVRAVTLLHKRRLAREKQPLLVSHY